jgi:hypothetical protein
VPAGSAVRTIDEVLGMSPPSSSQATWVITSAQVRRTETMVSKLVLVPSVESTTPVGAVRVRV